ncbi:MAG: fumarylacetoacetate hydrolase family protein [Rhodocyclaceae bacterium]
MSTSESFARLLDEAAGHATATAQIDPHGALTLADAYDIQRLSIARRLSRGERRVGVKMGFTSRAKMLQMGLSDVIWGRLTDAMHIAEDSQIDLARFVRPRVEPELAFLLRSPLEADATPAQALAAIEAVAPALEIIDSRYRDFTFTLPEVIADNASSSGFVVGPWRRAGDVDYANLGLVLAFDGRPIHVGSTAALLGHPLRALMAAARLSGASGEPLQAGWIVMAGGATAAEWLRPDCHVTVDMQTLGSAGFRTAPRA